MIRMRGFDARAALGDWVGCSENLDETLRAKLNLCHSITEALLECREWEEALERAARAFSEAFARPSEAWCRSRMEAQERVARFSVLRRIILSVAGQVERFDSDAYARRRVSAAKRGERVEK